MTRGGRAGAALALATVLAVLGASTAVAQGVYPSQGLYPPAGPVTPVHPLRPPTVQSGPRSDTTWVAVPPAYPAPPGTFVPLPGSGTPAPLLPPDERNRLTLPGSAPVWTPGRYEVVTGLDASGRVVHGLRWLPGRFESSQPLPSDR